MSELNEIKDLVQKQNEAWGEFQRTNDAIIAAKADGKSVAELNEKLTRINDDMAAMRKGFEEIEKRSGRAKLAGEIEASEDLAAYTKSFGLYIRKGRTEGLSELQQKAMNTGNDNEGGFTVLPEMDRTIDRIVPTISAMARLANNVTIGTAKYEKLVKTSGMTMSRVAEGATAGETTAPTYAKIGIEAYTAEVEPWVYNETLEDSFVNLEADLAMEAAIGFAEGLGAEFITGNGVGKARGITAYNNVANSSYAWGSVGYIASGASGAFAGTAPADKVISLQHALKAQYRPGAVFLTNDSTLGVMRQIKDASGSYYLWQPDPAAAFGGRFLGHPVEIDDNFAAIGAGTFSLAFGNFQRAYTIVNRAGTSLIRDNITSKGVTKFNFRRRVGGGIVNYEALKLMKFATS